jgi:hypothetical protein
MTAGPVIAVLAGLDPGGLAQILPRSGYVLSGAARYAWQHSIPPTKALRYSITFRTLRAS